MKTTRLGTTGLAVSRLALGMMTYGTPQWRPWVLDEAASRPLVQRAVELGFNFFDTADMYSAGESEVLTGRFVREFCRRDEVVVATKLYYPVDMAFGMNPRFEARPNSSGLSRKRVCAAVDASLRRLGLDHIDLLQIHRWDYATPIEETLTALHDVVRAGKVRYLGASSMWAWQFAKAQEVARRARLTPFVSMQNHYNLVYREEEREMIPLCRDQGVALVPWSPLARGFLAGNRGRDDKAAGTTARAATDDIAQALYYRDSDFRIVDALKALAAERGVAPATLAYAWLLAKPGVTAPIIGASKPGQIEAAVAALDVALSADELARLEAAYEPHPVLGHR
jgi:aryl-alcohol dehydrogenase-like predicted oxidoreductase